MISDRTLAVIALIIAIISLFATLLGLHYGIKQLNLALYQIEYPILNVTHQIDEDNGRLKILIDNTAKRKETGTINFYRLEISNSKPHLQLDSLKPRENITLDLEIEIDERNFTIPQGKDKSFQIPAYYLYFITERTSISYKITCDNCYPQGVIRRIPDFGAIESSVIFGPNYIVKGGVLPIYHWTTYSLEDLP